MAELTLLFSFLAGLLAPLTAVCVIPLYPAFLSYLASLGTKHTNKSLLGILVGLGVITSMLVIGFIFTFLLQVSLTSVIQIISPIAFFILTIVGILMVVNIDLGRFFPHLQSPQVKHPKIGAFLYGLFFGAIILPCNPAALIVLFALSTSITDVLVNMINFFVFGFGMALPLIALSILADKSKIVIRFITHYKREINTIVGILLIVVSIYYLFFVFKVYELLV